MEWDRPVGWCNRRRSSSVGSSETEAANDVEDLECNDEVDGMIEMAVALLTEEVKRWRCCCSVVGSGGGG